jgi:hypothetical protein
MKRLVDRNKALYKHSLVIRYYDSSLQMVSLTRISTLSSSVVYRASRISEKN